VRQLRQVALSGRGHGLIAVTVLVAIVASGVAVAASGSGTITACVHKHGGGLYEAKTCARGDKSVSWNAKGLRGARGLQGAPGAAVAYTATNSSAVSILSFPPALVVSQVIPAGSYLVTSTVELDANGTQNSYATDSCRLSDGTASDGSTYSGSLVVPEVTGYSAFGTVENQLTLTTTEQTTVSLHCGSNSFQNEPTSEEATNGVLTALKLSAVKD
jgi:hypothetical protein